MEPAAKSLRAGRYVKQSTGYRAFIPAALPPDPPIEFSSHLQNLLSAADRALGRLDGSIQILPNPDMFIYMYVRKEAVLSSQIEGTQSSLQDVLAAEAKILGADRPADVGEVVNYVNALNHGLARLSDLPVSIRLIKEIHAHLLRGVRGSHLTPGELRISQNWIGPSGCTLNEATFVPPPPHLVVEHLGELERYLHTGLGVPLLIQIGMAQVQFETIHPFLDGNGRVGRLMIALLLCERQVLQKPVLYLSYYFKRHRQRYYELLQAVRDEGAWEEWLAFFLTGVAEVSEQAAVTARDILALRERHRNTIAREFGRAAGKGHRILEHLFEHPVVSVKEIRHLLELTYPASNDLVSKLESHGILHEITGRTRHRMFLFRDYLNLFEADETDVSES